MDRKNAKKFVEELGKLQEKYGLTIHADYDEELDYTYEEEAYVAGVNAFIIIEDKEGHSITVDKLMDGSSNCYYCGRTTEEERDYCNESCKQKDKEIKQKQKSNG